MTAGTRVAALPGALRRPVVTWSLGATTFGGLEGLRPLLAAAAAARRSSFSADTSSDAPKLFPRLQICFMDSYPDFGFTIKKTKRDSVIPTPVASCELFVGRTDHRPPNTCSVTTTHALTATDVLTVQLIQSRRLNLRPDLSYIGLVRIA